MLNVLQSAITQSGHTVNIERPVPIKTESGGNSITWTPLATAVPCSMSHTSRSVSREYAKRGIVVTHRAYFNADPSILINDRLTYAGAKMVVVDVENVQDKSILWQVTCRWHV